MVSSDVIAKESLHDFRNALNQIYWEAECSKTEQIISSECWLKDRPEYTKRKWILEPKYKESRTKVIGKAIADCVTGENEFEGKTADNIITFDNQPNSAKKYIDPKNYKPEHWNAVILYNYVHEMINCKIGSDHNQYLQSTADVKSVLMSKMEKIKLHYNNKHDSELNKAVGNIQKYVEALWLQEALYQFGVSRQIYNKYQYIGHIVPSVAGSVPNNQDSKNIKFDSLFLAPSDKMQDKYYKQIQYKPTFSYYSGRLYISDLCIWELSQDKDNQYNRDEIRWRNYSAFKNHCEWLKERLGELVEIPDEELWYMLKKQD